MRYASMRGIFTTIKNIQIFISCIRVNGTRACSKNRTEILQKCQNTIIDMLLKVNIAKLINC